MTARGIVSRPDGRGPDWKLYLKVAVTAVLLALILWQVDWGELTEALTSASFSLVACVVILMMLSVTISAYKWQQLLLVHRVRRSLSELHRWYFIALFLNNFLPTSIGGDGYRVYKTLDNDRSRSCAVIAVVMERVSGIVVLVLMAYVAAGLLWLDGGPSLLRLFLLVSTVGGGLGLALIASHSVFGWGDRLLESDYVPDAAKTAWSRLDDFTSSPARSIWALGGISFLFHAHTVFYYWLLFQSLGHTASPAVLLVVLAITAIASVLPVSLNGIGVVEGSFVWTSVQFGIGYEVALSVIMIVRGIKLLQSGVGAALYAGRDREEVGTSAASESQDVGSPASLDG